MKKDHRTAAIEEYLSGELKEGELWEFRKQLETDESLRKELQLHLEIYEAVKDQKKWELLNTLSTIKSGSKKSERFTIYTWKTQAIAASIVFFIMVGSLLSSGILSNTSVNESIYNSYFTTENTILTVRSENTIKLQFIDEGLQLFKEGNYQSAIEVLNQDPSNMLAKLYSGFSYMKIEDFDKAEAAFNEIIMDKENLFFDQAEWNLALCYLITDQTAQAESIFKNIANGNTSYKERAQKILSELEN